MKPWQAIFHRWKRFQASDELTLVARGAGSSLVVQGLGLGLGYAAHVLLARWMGAAGYGVYTYVLAWAALLAVPAGGGLSLLVVRFVPEYRVREAWGLLRGLLQWGTAQALAVGVALALAASALVLLLDPSASGAYTRPLLVGLWMVPLQALLNLTSGVFQGLYRAGRAHALAALRHALVLAGAFALWRWGGGLTALAALLVTLAAALAVLALQGRPLLRALPAPALPAEAAYERPTWRRVALPLLLVSGFILILNQTDILMVGSLLGPREAGFYRAASKTASLVGIVFVAAVAAAGPLMAALHAEGARARLQRLASAVAHGIFWPSLALVLALALFAGPVLRLFGPDFGEARWVLIVLALGQLANAGAGLAATVLNLTGYQRWGASIFGWSALLNVALNAAGIALLGLLGAAAATALTTACTGVAFCLLARRKLRLDPSIVYALRGKAVLPDLKP